VPVLHCYNPCFIKTEYPVGFMTNPLTPNDHYICRTAPLTSKRSSLCIDSTNIGTEYFQLGINSPFFSFKMQVVS